VKTGRGGLSVVQVNYAFDNELTDPDALLDRYATLGGWAGSILQAGARRSAVVQRFHRRAALSRNGVDYVFTDRRIGATAATLGADVAHVNGIVFPVRTWLLRSAVARHTAIVVQSHSDGGAIGRAPLLRIAGRAGRGAVDAFLFAADEHAAAWRAAGFVGRGQPAYNVMPASTTFRRISRTSAREATGMVGEPAVLWVGRLNANKDPLTVVSAFETYAAANPGATLTLVYGTGELLGPVRDRIAGSDTLRARVKLAGAVAHDRMAEYFSAADLFVVGSHHEGSGYSLMEAMACGAVPVVPDIPTFRLLTRQGAVGALWTPGDAHGCAVALQRAAERTSAADRDRISEHFDRDFSWAAIGRRACEIYQEVVDRRRA
jgi:glycosyltransferase involved in cell wall biosynthesis